MIVDSSAILAILFDEKEARVFADLIARSTCRMSAANWFEASMIVDREDDPVARLRFDELILSLGIEIVAFTPEHADLARHAWRRYGRGRHSARLNFGDCMAYALATGENDTLLFKGDDFTETDIPPALRS